MAFLLILLGHFATAQLISGIPTTIFDCTHDYERVYCQLNSQNCSENILTLIEYFEKPYDCPLQQCSSEQCCCSAAFMLIIGEHFTAEVNNNKSESKTFIVTESFKPKTPTIKSVKESSGNFQVRWITNTDRETWNPEKAEITLYKKGDTEKVSKCVTPAKNDGFQYHEINGQDLDPGATYVVSLRSFSDQSKKFSDSSQEWEFKTPASYATLLYGLIPCLCVVFVIISAALYVCYVKLKENWWDSIPKPKVTMTHSTKPPIITPRDLTTFTSFEKEEALNKTVGAGSVALGNPHPERGLMRLDLHIFDRIRLDHPDLAKKFGLNLQTEISSAKDQSNSGSSSLFNQTYAMLFPNCSGQKQGASDSFCSSNTSGIVTDLDQQACLFPPHHDSSSCQKKIPSYTNSITSKEFESVDGSNELSNVFPCFPGSADEMLKLKNPTYGPLPAVSHGFIPMEDGYKPCQCQGDQSDALKSNVIEMFAQVPRDDHNQHLNINTKEFNAIPPNSFQPVENPKFNPFDINSQFPNMFPVTPNSCIIVVSEYHSV